MPLTAHDETTDPRRKGPVRRTLAGLAWMGDLGVACCLILGTLGGRWWGFDLLTRFRPQYAMAFALLTLVMCVCRAWNGLVVALLLCLFCLITGASWFGVRTTPIATTHGVTLARANVLVGNPDAGDILDELASLGADVIGLREVDLSFKRRLLDLPGYDVVASSPRSDSFGIALLVRRGADTPRTTCRCSRAWNGTEPPGHVSL